MRGRRVDLPIPFQLAARWSSGLDRDVSGWICSEKLDGVRAMWNGKGQLLSRGGLVLPAPKSFVEKLPRGIILDGELWIDRGMFSDAVSVIRTRSDWSMVKYLTFDAFNRTVKDYQYIDRLKFLQSIPHVHVIDSWVLPGSGRLELELNNVLASGGEGLVIRDPGCLYTPGRKSPSLSCMLKVKPFQDEEATILSVDLLPGRRGSVLVRDSIGCEFRISAGFRDVAKNFPPRVGSVITFGFSERHPDTKVPKCARFLRERLDSDI